LLEGKRKMIKLKICKCCSKPIIKGEIEECVQRKIPKIFEDNPSKYNKDNEEDRKQVTAIAFSMCREKTKKSCTKCGKTKVNAN
jgi:hypothetical protein